MDGIKRVFGQMLKSYREKGGLTQQELAKKLNVSRISVANYEAGKQSPPLEQLVRASVLLGFSLDSLKDSVAPNTIDSELSKLEPELRDKLKKAFDIEGD